MTKTNNPALINANHPQLMNDTEGSESGYSFRDSQEDLELTFACSTTPSLKEKDVAKLDKKKVKVIFKKMSLTVSYDGVEIFGEKAENGSSKLFAAIDPDDCTWSIVDNTKLVVTLCKADAKPWSSVVAK